MQNHSGLEKMLTNTTEAASSEQLNDKDLWNTLSRLFPQGVLDLLDESSEPAITIPAAPKVPDSRIAAVLEKGTRFQRCSWQDLTASRRPKTTSGLIL